MEDRIVVRNSTAEFLIFMAEGREDGVQVVYKDESIWCTQKAMAMLFDIDKSGISRHIKKIFSDGELSPNTTVAKIATVVNRGIRGEVEDELEYYNLDMVIAVGYRANSVRATQFRQWCTYVLRQFAESEYEKYRVIQDRLFTSDFDRMNKFLPFEELNWNTHEAKCDDL